VSEVPDISNLDYSQLSRLRAAVSERIKDMRSTAITQLRATIAEQAQLLGVGVELKELVPKKTRRRRKVDDADQG
jgi:hypothetical protein